MSTDPLDEVQRSASAGDVEGARNGLVRVLRADPQNIAAWELLATLVDDPDKRASCYRQILRIDPGNSQIAARLAALANQAPAASAEETSSIGKPRTLRCQQCGGAMEVRFAGELRDKRAVCGFCGSEIDLPDAFQRVETQHDHQHRPWGSHTVDTLLVETRIDYGADRQPAQDTPDIDEIRQLLREKGPDALNADTVQRLEEAGFTVSASLTAGVQAQLDSDDESRVAELLARLGLEGVSGQTGEPGAQTPVAAEDLPPGAGPLGPEDVVQLAGGALPEHERTKCPKCGAVVSSSAIRCDWCGLSLE